MCLLCYYLVAMLLYGCYVTMWLLCYSVVAMLLCGCCHNYHPDGVYGCYTCGCYVTMWLLCYYVVAMLYGTLMVCMVAMLLSGCYVTMWLLCCRGP